MKYTYLLINILYILNQNLVNLKSVTTPSQQTDIIYNRNLQTIDPIIKQEVDKEFQTLFQLFFLIILGTIPVFVFTKRGYIVSQIVDNMQAIFLISYLNIQYSPKFLSFLEPVKRFSNFYIPNTLSTDNTIILEQFEPEEVTPNLGYNLGSFIQVYVIVLIAYFIFKFLAQMKIEKFQMITYHFFEFQFLNDVWSITFIPSVFFSGLAMIYIDQAGYFSFIGVMISISAIITPIFIFFVIFKYRIKSDERLYKYQQYEQNDQNDSQQSFRPGTSKSQKIHQNIFKNVRKQSEPISVIEEKDEEFYQFDTMDKSSQRNILPIKDSQEQIKQKAELQWQTYLKSRYHRPLFRIRNYWNFINYHHRNDLAYFNVFHYIRKFVYIFASLLDTQVDAKIAIFIVVYFMSLIFSAVTRPFKLKVLNIYTIIVEFLTMFSLIVLLIDYSYNINLLNQQSSLQLDENVTTVIGFYSFTSVIATNVIFSAQIGVILPLLVYFKQKKQQMTQNQNIVPTKKEEKEQNQKLQQILKEQEEFDKKEQQRQNKIVNLRDKRNQQSQMTLMLQEQQQSQSQFQINPHQNINTKYNLDDDKMRVNTKKKKNIISSKQMPYKQSRKTNINLDP